MKITFPWPPKELSPNSRVHWAKKAKCAAAYKQNCYVAAKMEVNKLKYTPPAGRLHLFITFHPPDRRRRDDDNCPASFKSGRDALALAIGVDDCIFISHPFLSDKVVKGGAVVVTVAGEPYE